LALLPSESLVFAPFARQRVWTYAVRFRDRYLYKPVKQPTTVRIDADGLHWLKSKGRGYQTRLNAILREAMKKDVA
jgi:uncharacterized protein (DUF4415 family)